MNPVIKRTAERLLNVSGAASVARRRRRNDVLVLAYHDVLAPGQRASGDRSLHLNHAQFAAQLDALVTTHDVVPLESTHRDNPRSTKPRIAITFDDAYRSAIEVAVPELVARGMSATIFVAPDLLGRTPWWDVLADDALGAVPQAARERALTDCRGEQSSILPASMSGAIGSENRIATEAELTACAALPGITIGSHSWSHANLAALPAEALAGELARSRDWLSARYASYIPWVAYPYGLFTASVERSAAEAGYAGALRVDGGWMTPGAHDRPWAIPRFNVPAGLSTDGFRLRLAGIGKM